jgi:hypothetical protein
MKYDEAFTLITNTQLNLIKPTEKMKQVFSQLGIASAEAGIQAYGFQGFLEQIEQQAGGTASELGQVYGRIRGLRGAMGLGSKYADTYNNALEQIQKSSADTLFEAKEFIFKTNAKQLELEFNAVNVALTNFGRNLTSVSLGFINTWGGAANTMKSWTTAVSAGAFVWLGLRNNWVKSFTIFSGGMQTAFQRTQAFNKLWKGLAASPLFWATAVTGAILLIEAAMNKAVNEAKKANERMRAAFEGRNRIEMIKADEELSAQERLNSVLLAEIQKFIIKRKQLVTDAFKGEEGLLKSLTSGIGTQLSSQVNNISSLFDNFTSKLTSIRDDLREINQESANIKGEIADWQFDRSLNRVDAIHQIYRQLTRAQTLSSDAQREAAKGEFESARAIQERAENYAKSALSAAEETKNIGLVRRAEDAVTESLNNRLALQNRLKQSTVTQFNIINKQVPKMKQLQAALEPKVERYKAIAKELEKPTLRAADRERLEKELKPLAAEIQGLFGDIKIYAQLANLTNLRTDFDKATQGFFDPLTGQLTTFENAVINSVGKINAAFAGIKSGPLKVLFGGELTIDEQQKSLVELQQLQGDAKLAAIENTQAQRQLSDEIRLQPGLVALFNAELQKTGKFTSPQLIGNVSKPIVNLVSQLNALAQSGRSLTPEFIQQLQTLRQYQEILQEAQDTTKAPLSFIKGDEAGALQQIIDSFIKISEAQKTITATSGETRAWELLVPKLKEVSDAIGIDMVQAANQAATGMSNSAVRQIQALNDIQQAAINTKNAIGSIGVGVQRSKGGYIYKAAGGPVGTDTIPAMLSPGEFVVNAGSTRKFFSQLMAINSGRSPLYRANGGPVNTTNVGDIKINISEAQSAKVTARETITAIRRELRRGSSKI